MNEIKELVGKKWEMIEVNPEKIEFIGIGNHFEIKRNNLQILSFPSGEGILFDTNEERTLVINLKEGIYCYGERDIEGKNWIWCKVKEK